MNKVESYSVTVAGSSAEDTQIIVTVVSNVTPLEGEAIHEAIRRETTELLEHILNDELDS